MAPTTWIVGHIHSPEAEFRGSLEMRKVDDPPYRVSSTIDASGEFAIPVPAGTYQIEVSMSDNYARYSVLSDGSLAAYTQPDPIVLEKGDEFHIEDGLGSFLIRAHFPDGFRGAHVVLRLDRIVAPDSTVPFASMVFDREDSDHTYSVPHLLPGSYTYWIYLGSEYPDLFLDLDGERQEVIEIEAEVELTLRAELEEPTWVEFQNPVPEQTFSIVLETYPDPRDQRYGAHLTGQSIPIKFFAQDFTVAVRLGATTRYLTPDGLSLEPYPYHVLPGSRLPVRVPLRRIFADPPSPGIQLDLVSEDGFRFISGSGAQGIVYWEEAVRVHVQVLDPEENGASHWLGGALRMSESPLIDLATTDRVPWTSMSGGTVYGTLPDEPVSNFTWFSPENGPDFPSLPPAFESAHVHISPDSTSFTIEHAPIGVRVLRVQASDRWLYYPGVSDPDSAEHLLIEPGATLEGLEFR
ncbi:MAG: hypothetical protein R3E97_16055 [Candidatus Eisenbacteria bacterium]